MNHANPQRKSPGLRSLIYGIATAATIALAPSAGAITPAHARDIVRNNVLCDLLLENQYWSGDGVFIAPDFLVNKEKTEQGNGTYLCPGLLCNETYFGFMNVETPFTPEQIAEMNLYGHPWTFLNAASYPTDSSFYVAAKSFWDQYVFNTDCPGIPTADADDNIPAIQGLTNSPNPFQSSTVISYVLEKDAPVCVDIFNAAGQKVRSLAEGYQTRGIHDLVWDRKDDTGKEEGPGVFFYRVMTPEGTQTNRMIALR